MQHNPAAPADWSRMIDPGLVLTIPFALTVSISAALILDISADMSVWRSAGSERTRLIRSMWEEWSLFTLYCKLVLWMALNRVYAPFPSSVPKQMTKHNSFTNWPQWKHDSMVYSHVKLNTLKHWAMHNECIQYIVENESCSSSRATWRQSFLGLSVASK